MTTQILLWAAAAGLVLATLPGTVELLALTIGAILAGRKKR